MDEFTISRNRKQVGDVLHTDDMRRLYFAAEEHIDQAKVKAFDIGGCIENSMSLLELFTLLEELTEVKLQYTELSVRKSDQRVFLVDYQKARQSFNWYPTIDKESSLRCMLEWSREVQVHG